MSPKQPVGPSAGLSAWEKGWEGFSPIGLNGVFEFIRNREMYPTRVSKVNNFPYGQ